MTEKERLSMELDVEDPAFSLMRIQLSGELKKAFRQMDDVNAEEATVTMKVRLCKIEGRTPAGSACEKLEMDYKITRAVTLKEQAGGPVTELNKFEIAYDDQGEQYLRRIDDPQHKIEEYL